METFGTVFFIIFILAGILSAIFPEYAWYLRHGIWYKDSEPSDDALFFTRLGSIALAVLGIFILLTMLWS